MFTASHCLSCPCYLELIAFSKSVCWFWCAQENMCVFDCECAHFSAFVYLFWCILVVKCTGNAFMYLSVYVVTLCTLLLSCNPLTFSDLISRSCVWCKWPNPLDFQFKLSGQISKLNDRSTSAQSLWEAESAIKSRRRLKKKNNFNPNRVWWEPENLLSLPQTVHFHHFCIKCQLMQCGLAPAVCTAVRWYCR